MKKTQGFTLLELVVSFVLISIIMIYGLSSFNTYMEQTRADMRIMQLYSALAFIRNDVFSTHEAGVICPSADKQSCGGDWSGDLIVFLDDNQNHTLDEGETLLRIIQPTTGGTLTWQGFGSSKYLMFLPYGLTNQQNGTFFYCSPAEQKKIARGIIVNKSGRARLAQVTDQGGIIDANGEEVQC